MPTSLDMGAMGAVDRSTSHLVVLSLGWMQRFEKLLCDSAKGYLLPLLQGWASGDGRTKVEVQEAIEKEFPPDVGFPQGVKDLVNGAGHLLNTPLELSGNKAK